MLPLDLGDVEAMQPTGILMGVGPDMAMTVVADMTTGTALAAEAVLLAAIGSQSDPERTETGATNGEVGTTTIENGPTMVAHRTIHASCEGIECVDICLPFFIPSYPNPYLRSY